MQRFLIDDNPEHLIVKMFWPVGPNEKCQTAEQHLNYKSLVNPDYFLNLLGFTKVKHELPKGKLNSPQANTDWLQAELQHFQFDLIPNVVCESED